MELALDERGSGVATAQLHGLTSSRARDEALGLDLTRGAGGLHVVRYDACGHGQSSGTADPADYTWPVLAGDLLGVLDATVGLCPVVGVGQSMGAATLLHAAVREPGRFRALVLAIPPTAWELRPAQARGYAAAARLVERRGRSGFVESTRDLPRPPAVDPGRPHTGPDVRESYLPAAFRGAAASDLPGPDEVAALDLPVLLLPWPGDLAHPVAVAERLHTSIRGSVLETAETPADVAAWPERIERFVQEVCGRA